VIGATALTLDFRVVPANHRDFKRIPDLAVELWDRQ